MKKIKFIFLALGMLICLIPFAGMALYPTEKTGENKKPAEFPSLTTKDGGLNTDFYTQFDTWFNEHFAFRNEIVMVDAMVQGRIFGTSAEEQVIYGSDGWLYYASTLSDYLGTGCMTERERFNLRHNLELVQSWADAKGVELLLTVPPNKNTLYGKHMPYYDSMIVNPDHTLYELPKICEEAGVAYADLYTMFKEKQETLYLLRDSHWNGKGALLAYQTIMEKTGRSYEDYADASATRSRSADGDLNRMLYSVYGDPEMDTKYEIPQEYRYTTATESVEDAWILTETPGKEGSLVMFRDSFGNTLLPIMANQFGRACFTKESPYRLQKVVEEQRPELVIIEKVERNLRDFITQPPIIAAAVCSDIRVKEAEESEEGEEKSGTDETENFGLKSETSQFDSSMTQITGSVPEELLKTDTEILLQIDGTFYSTYHIGTDGFMVYLDESGVPSDGCTLKVILKDGDSCRTVYEKKWEKEQ